MFCKSLVRSGLLAYKQDFHSGLKCVTAACVNVGVVRQESSSTVLARDKLKTMEDLGGPSFLTSLYWLFGKGYFSITHQMQIEHRNIYGPLWKSKYGPLVIVNVAQAELIEQVLRKEGRYPIRTDMPHWRGYRELRNQAYGPLTGLGEEWQRIRRILNPRILKPKHVSSYTNAINDVVRDFIEKVAWLRATNGNGVMVHDLAGELYKFAFEGICSVVFETRLGCLDKVIPEETQKVIFSVGEMFRLSSIILLYPKSIWPYVPDWKRFVAVWDHLFKVAGDLIQKKTADIQEKLKQGLSIDGEYLTHLLISEQMTPTEVLGSVTELLLAGIDTTSNTMSWALYHLAQDPEAQQKLYDEIISVCPGDKMTSSEDISMMPWLKAVVRETLRLYPVVPGNARVNAENEIVVGGYLFPKNTLFHLCHYAVSYDESIFPDPHTFSPQRWLREEKHLNQHPFASVPFGFGIRSCLGRRVAELEMYLLLSQLIKHYEVRPDPTGKTVKPVTRTVLVPGTSIDLQFIDRQVGQKTSAKTQTA